MKIQLRQMMMEVQNMKQKINIELFVGESTQNLYHRNLNAKSINKLRHKTMLMTTGENLKET